MEDGLSGTIKDKTHEFHKRVYYSDTDAGGIVYHSRYIDMAEHARTELFRLLGGEQHSFLKDSGIGFVVRSLTVSYNRPAFLDDTLLIRTTLSKCETFTIVFDQNIFRKGHLICEISVKAACISLNSGKPSPMPEEWKELIRRNLLSPRD